MSDKKSEREKEKERLYKEVMSRNRNTLTNASGDEVQLTTGSEVNLDDVEVTHDETIKALDHSKDLLNRADNAVDQLRQILQNQQKELNDMASSKEFSQANVDMDQMQKEIEKDYGIKPEDAVQARVPLDSGKEFGEVLEEVKAQLVGNDDALAGLATAFRRPYVMGEEEGKARNVIIVTGPKGCGRHAALTAMVRSLARRQIFVSDEVYTMDMSLYQSGSQEAIFLQDLYRALQGKGSVICFENFEVSFPGFLRMIDSLVTTGSVTLSKRYVLTKGVLVENQTGLVKETVDSLSVSGKYLVFFTTGGVKAVQNAFGADFLYHVLDIVEFKALSAEDIKLYAQNKAAELVGKADSQLHLKAEIDPEVLDWICTNYDKTSGADAVNEYFHNFYIGLSELVLKHHLFSEASAHISIVNDVPCAKVEDETVTLLRSKTSAEEIKAVNEELDQIVGLQEIKSYIRSLESHIRINEVRKAQGMKTAEVSKHMIFTGNPGTGKTTIARLISRYMKAIGALSNGQLVEVTRADLVAQYVGQTAPLTMSVIKSAIGGVLFIDEAYSLYRGKDDSFGLECIDTIVKAMEDNRDNLIVILAGYKKEMSVFLESNSGLKSRFPNIINFPDYTGEELRQIAEIQAKSKGYKITDEALPQLEQYFTTVQSINAAEAGNGRLARNVVEEAILKQAQRLVSHPEDPMDELRLEDFDLTVRIKPAGMSE